MPSVSKYRCGKAYRWKTATVRTKEVSMRYGSVMKVMMISMLAIGVRASVTVDFDPSGKFASNFSGGVYAESASGGLNGSIGLIATNIAAATSPLPQVMQ